jgi:hypothetical protein
VIISPHGRNEPLVENGQVKCSKIHQVGTERNRILSGNPEWVEPLFKTVTKLLINTKPGKCNKVKQRKTTILTLEKTSNCEGDKRHSEKLLEYTMVTLCPDDMNFMRLGNGKCAGMYREVPMENA